PFLLMLYPAHMAIQMNIILSICLSAFMIFKIRNEVDKALLMRLIKGSILGLVFGIFVYLYLDIQLLKMTVCMIILILTILMIYYSLYFLIYFWYFCISLFRYSIIKNDCWCDYSHFNNPSYF